MSKRRSHDRAETIEDLRFLVAHDVPFDAAARRLGFVSAKALEKWLSRNDLNEVARELSAISNRYGLNRYGEILEPLDPWDLREKMVARSSRTMQEAG